MVIELIYTTLLMQIYKIVVLSVKTREYFLIHPFEYLLWVLKRTVALRSSLEFPQHIF